MDFFELKTAMVAKAPVMTRIVQPSYTHVVVGRVVGVCCRLDPDGKEINQAEIQERGKNSVVVVPFEKVDKLWEGASVGG